jgi:hypothetical protein
VRWLPALVDWPVNVILKPEAEPTPATLKVVVPLASTLPVPSKRPAEALWAQAVMCPLPSTVQPAGPDSLPLRWRAGPAAHSDRRQSWQTPNSSWRWRWAAQIVKGRHGARRWLRVVSSW